MMANLMIGIVDDVWSVQIENVPGLIWEFKGADLATQATWVREFATQMSEGAAEFAVSALDGVGFDELAVTIETLFGDTTGILLEGQVAFLLGADEDAALIDFLVQAGAALLEFL
jgi:hypothetical protein